MRISILVPEYFFDLNFILKEINSRPKKFNYSLEFLISDSKAAQGLYFGKHQEFNFQNFSVLFINADDCNTIGEKLNNLFKKGTGTYFISLRHNTAVNLLLLDRFIASIEKNNDSLCFVFNSLPRPLGSISESLEVKHLVEEVSLNKAINYEKLMVWKRASYIIIGGFDKKLNLSADIDFENRLLKISRSFICQKILNRHAETNFNSAHNDTLSSNKFLTSIPSNINCDPPKSHKKTFFFCLSHRTPLYELPGYVNLINVSSNTSIGDYQSSDFISDFTNWEELLLGEVGIFVVSDLLRTLDISKLNDHFVALCYYRKFFSTSTFGPPVITGDPIYTVLQNDVSYALVADEIAGRFVKPTITEYNNLTVLEAYSQSHCLEDYLFATQLAVKIGILKPTEVDEFLSMNRFIHWAHASCTIPLSLFLEITDKLRSLLITIIASGYRSPLRHIPYQRRWVAFYFERLSSYFLIKHYPDWNAQQSRLHNVNLQHEGVGVFNPGGLYSETSIN